MSSIINNRLLTRVAWLAACVLAAALLFLGLYHNTWRAVRPGKFKNFELDSESLVIARMVEARQRGLLAENGLLGWGDANPANLNESDYTHQYDVYLSGQKFQSYSLYKSVSGFQAMLFSALDEISPFSPAINLRNFRVLSSLLFALVLSAFLAWLLYEFGWLTFAVGLLTTLVSGWITLFGRNLFYSIWASFLPLALLAWYLAWEQRKGMLSNRLLAVLGFAGILCKCMVNGYDFILPALAMPVIPLVYYGLREQWGARLLARRLGVLLLALGAAVLVSLLILAAQLRVSEGSFAGGLISIARTLSRRSYGDPSMFPGYEASLEANPWSVLWTYVAGDTAIYLININFLAVIVTFAAFTLLFIGVDSWRRPSPEERGKAYALMGATWLSLLSPVSWFLIFKGQAYIHTFTNYLAWHMPFTLFGFAFCGYVLQCLLVAARKSAVPKPAESPA